MAEKDKSRGTNEDNVGLGWQLPNQPVQRWGSDGPARGDMRIRTGADMRIRPGRDMRTPGESVARNQRDAELRARGIPVPDEPVQPWNSPEPLARVVTPPAAEKPKAKKRKK